MDFNFTQRAVEAGIDLNKCSDDVRASFMLNNIDDAAKLQSIETARAEIHKYLGPAVPVYRRDKEGRPTAVAIGIVQPTVDWELCSAQQTAADSVPDKLYSTWGIVAQQLA
jgi:hypothetical protein